MLLLDTIEKSLARMDIPQLISYYADETAAMYDGTNGTVDDITAAATWSTLQTINPAAFAAWQRMDNATADLYPVEARTPEIIRAIEDAEIVNLRVAYGI